MRCQTLFFFYNSFPVHAVDGLVMIYYPGIFFFFFFAFLVDPPLCHWDPSLIVTVLLAERYLIPRPDLRFMIIISSACGEIADLEIVWTTLSIWKRRPCCSRHPTGPKWFEPSDRHFHPQSPQCSQSKYLIYFTAGHRGENIKEPNDENREKKDLYESLSVDTIIESCLILMVLLLLTCARHLIVDCTALNSPIYPVTASSRGHKEALCLPNCSPPFTPLRHLFWTVFQVSLGLLQVL